MSFGMVLAGLQGLSSIGGLLGASSARKRAEAARQQSLVELMREMDMERQGMIGENARTMYSEAGTAGDAVRALGANLGSALAGAGVYNSSATAGAVAQAQSEQQRALGELSARLKGNERSLMAQNKRFIAGQKLGFASEGVGLARENEAGARNSLLSFLGSLNQYNQQKMDVPNARNQGYAMNGNQNATPVPLMPISKMFPTLQNAQLGAPAFSGGGQMLPLNAMRLSGGWGRKKSP